jgi:hypothetical protein
MNRVAKEEKREYDKKRYRLNREILLQQSRNYYKTHRKSHSLWKRAYYAKHREQLLQHGKLYYKKHIKYLRLQHRLYDREHKKERRLYNQEHAKEFLQYHRERHKNRRQLFLDMYGNKCACCSEKEPAFLTLDHIGGRRGEEKKDTYQMYYRKATHHYDPTRYRILCMNCNHATRWGRICPHQIKKAGK